MISVKVAIFCVAFTVIVREISGHGMMMDPPNRSSLWRFDDSFPENYNDNENFCGGFGVQWGTFGGKCGVCGDNYGDPVPRRNENTGTFGLGKVVSQYNSGDIINISILLTANHMGSFSYSICELKDPSQAETEECFKELLLEDGSASFSVDPSSNSISNNVRLPAGLTCERCVLRWHYTTGNSWGDCGNGQGAIGCGPQETFRSCSDIRVV